MTGVTKRKKLVYMATHGFAIRMIFQTGLLARLSGAGHDVTVIVPDAGDANLVELSRRDGVTLREYPAPQSKWNRPLKTLRKYVVENIRGNPSLWDKHQRTLNKQGVGKVARRAVAGAGLLLNDVVERLPVFRRAFLAIEAKLLLRDAALDFVRSLGSDLLVSTYPVAPPEPELLLAARHLGVKTCIHLLSWDNITAKGHFQALADQYIVWGPIMAEELREYYGVEQARIKACGVPHFDLYYHPLPPVDTDFLREVSAARPYLFFAMSASLYAPGETDIIEQLCAATAPGEALDGCTIVARPHPSALSGVLRDDRTLSELKRLEAERGLKVSYPRLVKDSKMAWSVRNDDMYELVALIQGAAVVINSGSTVNVEALAMGRPVVVTAFDGRARSAVR